MVRITNTIEIDAPTERVYLALRTLDAYTTWLKHSPVYRGTTMRTPPTGAAVTYEDMTTVGRLRGALVEDVPNRALQFHQSKPSGSLDALIRYDLDSVGTGTHLTRVGELKTRGIFRIVQPILLRMAAAESERTIKSLKAHLERTK